MYVFSRFNLHSAMGCAWGKCVNLICTRLLYLVVLLAHLPPCSPTTGSFLLSSGGASNQPHRHHYHTRPFGIENETQYSSPTLRALPSIHTTFQGKASLYRPHSPEGKASHLPCTHRFTSTWPPPTQVLDLYLAYFIHSFRDVTARYHLLSACSNSHLSSLIVGHR